MASEIVELGSEDLIEEVENDRASILSAAASAQNIAMLTGTHGVVAPPLMKPRVRLPSPDEIREAALPDPDDAERGRLRAFVAARSGDPVGEVRARLELAHLELDRGNVEAARKEAAVAIEIQPGSAAARALLRRLSVSRERVAEQLEHATELVASAAHPETRAGWLCERARLLEALASASGDDASRGASIKVWTEALGLVPDHAGALYGTEVALDREGKYAEHAELLGHLATLVGEADVAAWLHVERALLLDRRLGQLAEARAAFDRALELAPGIGPVRDAATDHAFRHRDDPRLAELLRAEAELEAGSSPRRAARLELDAALAGLAGGLDRAEVVRILERARGRAPTTPLVDVRVGEELARLHDADGRHAEALRARKEGLRFLEDPREELVVLRALAASAIRAGDTDAAVLALERARVVDPDDPTLLGELDAVFVKSARHDARAVLWMREAARVEDPSRKAKALLTAAESASAAGRPAEARKHREAAWITAPSEPGVYDALAEHLAPVASSAAIAERIGLYEQAIRATKDPDRRIHLLEKLAWLADDVAGDASSAVRAYQEILTIEPGRLSAILGLGSAATRAGDLAGRAKALLAQAEVTSDSLTRAELRLRAAEALTTVDPERALAVGEELRGEPKLAARASELVTELHLAAGRFERAAAVLAERARVADADQKIALVLAQARLLLGPLRAADRALEALSGLPESLAADPAVRESVLEALEVLGDPELLRAELGRLATLADRPDARARLLVRAAEIDERAGRDDVAVRGYEAARAAAPDPLIDERLRRLGARAVLGEVSADLVSPLLLATRTIDTDRAGSAEPLLATGARDIATLRLAERLARRAGSPPQLANALALTADAWPSGLVAQRALEGLASLFAWTLRESADYEPWERLLALGAIDAAGIDTLLARADARIRDTDLAAIQTAIAAVARRVAQASDDTERLLLHLELGRLHRRLGSHAEAGKAAALALDADEGSLSAATLLAETAADTGDSRASIRASRALATIVVTPKARAEFLRDAADLTVAHGDKEQAAELLEQALRADPEDVQVAARLADLQRARGAFEPFARTIRVTLEAARTTEAIVPMASELADVARNHLKDPMLAVWALERIREVSPNHVPTLFLLAELFIGLRSWDKALDALGATVAAASERADKLVALVGRASIYRKVLQQPALAEAELRAALEVDPHDVRAIKGLLELGDETVRKEERAVLLGRLAIGETAPVDRLRALIELADARRAVGDVEGAEGALVEAASLSPDPKMLERIRSAVGSDTSTLARVLSKAVSRAREGGRAIDASWLVSLGQIELDLGRFDEAIDRFEEALRGDDGRDEARILLARALAARGRHAHVVEALAPILAGTTRQKLPVDAGIVRLFESSLNGAGLATERWVARELRAVAGDLAPNEQAELDARLSNLGYAEGLSATSLRRAVMPGSLGRHPIWDLAAAASGLAGKVARVGLSDQGSSTRDRVKPRTTHPVRPIFDRLLRAFELTEVELAVSDHVTEPAIACEDVPWLVVPAAVESYPDAYAIASLARPMTRIALGVPWLGALPPDDVLAILVAFARSVSPNFAGRPPERIESLVSDYEPRVRRALDRKRRRMLEELAPMLERAAPVDVGAFADTLGATEARAAFLLSGSLRATLDTIAPSDAALLEALRIPGPPSLAAVFGRASSRDLASFALSRETTALRRSLGTA